MAAPSLAALYDFETQFEDAAQAILISQGIDAYISEWQGALPLVNTGLSFEVGPATSDLTFLPLASGQSATRPYQDYFRYTGNLDVEVRVNRDVEMGPSEAGVTSFLAQVRGMIRATFMKSQWPFYNTNLPYYRVSDIRPNGTTSGFDKERNVDTVILRFAITFAIQPSAWPSGFPPAVS